ncbi:TadE family protein [Psychromicrobium xiongbiense]|uniref:TadE family protein n=1 Tax=Psychromicrobium xiongbiense TaxID=3051184 RepID=UPI002556A155|nr:TadE family protein [Psychromicrobium sp. YIM S02556]
MSPRHGAVSAGEVRQARDTERGSAIVDFVLVGALLTLILLSIVQLALVLHVRNTLIDAAASGARYGILMDRTPQEAVSRTQDLVGTALNPAFAREVSASEEMVDGVRTLKITVRAPLPFIGLFGPAGLLVATGHAAFQR